MKILRFIYISLIFVCVVPNASAQDDISIEAVDFNTDQSEYAPVFYKSGIVYCGDNVANEAITYIEEKSGNQLTDLFFVNDSSKKSKPVLFSKLLKTSFHDGPICFTSDENTAYFTRSQLITKKLKNRVEHFNKFGIFKATFNGEDWVDVTACEFNSPDYNVGHPTLSPDGKLLYVVSDKPDGYGGSDLYYSIIKDGKCGDLINLGSNVNSLHNETFPRIDADGKLYYSSNRTGGQGGLDIYTSQRVNDTWAKPTALDTSINSPFDDFGLVYNEDYTQGYFSSNRNGSDDIYKITITYPPFKNCVPHVKELLCYEFYEEATLNADSVAMVYEWDFGDGHTERSIETYHCYTKPGVYEVRLNIMDPMVGKTFVNEATYELEIEEINQPNIICPDTISMNQGFKIQITQGNWKDYIINNYYIDYGDSTAVIKNEKDRHFYKEAGVRTIKVLIAGFDKGTGEVSTNCFLKAIFVKENESLISETEFIDQLTYSGFNSDKIENFDDAFYSLQILSTDSSVLDDKEVLKGFTGRVTELYNPETGEYSYITGKAQGPFAFIVMFRAAHEQGFNDALVRAYEEGKVKVSDMAMMYNKESGEVNIVLENIQFKYDGDEPDENSLKELDKLIDFLRANPDLKIEIGAHTDGSRRVEKAKAIFKKRGQPYTREAHDKMSSSYNLRLSQKRADNVVEYLVKKGIKRKRLEAKGYGETKPLEPNWNEDGTDNLDGQARNRRVEFRILN